MSKEDSKMTQKKRGSFWKILLIVFLVLDAAALTAFAIVWHKLDLIQYEDEIPDMSSTNEIQSRYEDEIPDTASSDEIQSQNEDKNPIVSEPIEASEDTLSTDEIQSLEEELYANLLANAEPVEFEDDVFSVLLLGNDSRNNKTNERTDVMLLVSIKRSSKQIVLTSFLRDLYVYIPGHGSNRLNAANVFGGPELTIETIEQNFGIRIDAYAAVSFECFENIIDSFGGVDVELSTSELNMLPYYGVSSLGDTPGVYHLDGAHTLSYCRNRYSDSDFGRTNRQRTVLAAVWEKTKDASLSKLYDLFEEVLPQITTSLSKSECLSLLLQVIKIKNYELSTLHIPVDGGYSNEVISGMMVLVPNFEVNNDIIHRFLYEGTT